MVLEIRAREGSGSGELVWAGRHLGVHPEALRGSVKRAYFARELGPGLPR
jgi:hypothetical protein